MYFDDDDIPFDDTNGFDYAPVDTVNLFGAAGPPTWLVDGLLLEQTTTVLAAPMKCLATSISLDLVVSVATGTPFLGCFPVAQQRRVAYLTAPSRQAEVRAKVRAICSARGVEPVGCQVDWVFDMPRIHDPGEAGRLAEALAWRRVGLLVIDPLFLALDGCDDVSPTNVYQFGSVLESFAERCLQARVMPVLVHHTVKYASRAYSNEPPRLQDVAFAGVGEVARQWLLLSRPSRFNASVRRHALNLAAGGSYGHASDWRLTVDEGPFVPEGPGAWRVQVEPHRGSGAGGTWTDSSHRVQTEHIPCDGIPELPDLRSRSQKGWPAAQAAQTT